MLGVSESHLLSAIASCNNILHSKSPTVHSAVVLISHDHNTVTTPNMNSSSCVEKSAARTRHDSWDRARGALSDDGYANIIPNQNAYAKRCHPVRRWRLPPASIIARGRGTTWNMTPPLFRRRSTSLFHDDRRDTNNDWRDRSRPSRDHGQTKTNIRKTYPMDKHVERFYGLCTLEANGSTRPLHLAGNSAVRSSRL